MLYGIWRNVTHHVHVSVFVVTKWANESCYHTVIDGLRKYQILHQIIKNLKNTHLHFNSQVRIGQR